MSLPTYGEVPSSILGSAVGLFYRGELFHGMYGLGVSVFLCLLSMVSSVLFSEEAPALC
jgi:hypothetical protein